jgi:general secretion pathway protein C
MRSILCVVVIAVPSFAAGLDGQKLGKLLGLGTGGPSIGPQVPPAMPSPLPWRLLGTLRASDGASMAAVECSLKSVTLQVGDVRDGVEVISIEQQTVTVLRQGRLELVGARPGTGVVSQPLPRAGRTISRQLVDQVLANPERMFQEVQLMPAMVAGRLTGFRARWVKEGSIISSLGLRAGDTITKVNGLPLDNLQRVLSLLQVLTTTGRFEVELERNGQRLIESVQVEPLRE